MAEQKTNCYSYIITGSGCAGLSLLMRMMGDPFFDNKEILVIDKSLKNENDRTWCFWEDQPGIFESIVYHRWKQLDFFAGDFFKRLDIAPYSYKMIRSLDLYNYVLGLAAHRPRIHFITGEVESVFNLENKAGVTVDGKIFQGDYLFNSISFAKPQVQKHKFWLLQHFKGWVIETKTNHFEENIARFMDFRVDQEKGASFVYVLPLAGNKALVEYTQFSASLLPAEAYDQALNCYIRESLSIGSFEVTGEEFGVIPMTNFQFPSGTGRIINIGTAGGQTKGSSGFTFQFIQKNTKIITDLLKEGKYPRPRIPYGQKRFQLYDSILLNILTHKKMSAPDIFTRLFKNNAATDILKFLDNETNPGKELKIMQSMPAKYFFPAALIELLNI